MKVPGSYKARKDLPELCVPVTGNIGNTGVVGTLFLTLVKAEGDSGVRVRDIRVLISEAVDVVDELELDAAEFLVLSVGSDRVTFSSRVCRALCAEAMKLTVS